MCVFSFVFKRGIDNVAREPGDVAKRAHCDVTIDFFAWVESSFPSMKDRNCGVEYC